MSNKQLNKKGIGSFLHMRKRINVCSTVSSCQCTISIYR